MADANPIIVVLTMPTDNESPTLMIRRGDLAHIRQIVYDANTIGEVIKDAYVSLVSVEEAPPVIPAPPEPPKPAPRPAAAPAQAAKPKPKEPEFKLILGKRDFIYVPERLVQGLDREHTLLALPLITKLIEGKLWDGKSPIRIDDINTLQTKMRHLDVKSLSLFSLTDFVQPGENIVWQPPADPEPAIDETEESDDIDGDYESDETEADPE